MIKNDYCRDQQDKGYWFVIVLTLSAGHQKSAGVPHLEKFHVTSALTSDVKTLITF